MRKEQTKYRNQSITMSLHVGSGVYSKRGLLTIYSSRMGANLRGANSRIYGTSFIIAVKYSQIYAKSLDDK